MIVVSRRGYDLYGSGVNPAEHVLSAEAIASRGIALKRTLNYPGDARGAEAQTLVAPGVIVGDTKHNLLIKATLANQVLAFDAQTGAQLWEATLGPPIKNTQAIDSWGINDHWGILGTPVFDSLTAPTKLFCCCWTSPDGSVTKARHVLEVVSLGTGETTRDLLSLEGAFYEPGGSLPTVKFASAARKQRGSLLFASGPKFGPQGVVFIPFGSIRETSESNKGWIIAVDVARWQITAALATTTGGFGGGIWQAGAPLVMDADGYIYAMSGNGDFDPERANFGECVLKMQYSPPQGTPMGQLNIVDWWSPFLDRQRGIVSIGETMPTNNRAYANLSPEEHAARMDSNGNVPLAPDEAIDMDLGSGGPVLVPSLGIVIAAGKDGILYPVRTDQMGKTALGDFQTSAGVIGNYRKLAHPPIWFTSFAAGWLVDPMPVSIRSLNYNWGGKTHHNHGGPLVWDTGTGFVVTFVWGENSPLRAFGMSPAAGTSPELPKINVGFMAQGNEIASAGSPYPTGGMPGGFMSLAWDGQNPDTAFLAAMIPYGDANRDVTAGRLLVYDLRQLRNGQLPVIWDSWKWGPEHEFNFPKFTPPLVANGQIIRPSYEHTDAIYELP